MRKIYLKQNICFLPEYKSIVFFNSKNKDLEIEQIKKIGIEEPLIQKNISYIKNLIPLRIDIFPTYHCNLRCLYCYAGTGDYEFRSLSIKQIDSLVMGLLKTIKLKKIASGKDKNSKITSEIYFAGGGEPTYRWDLLTYTVDKLKSLAKENDFIVNFAIITNGMIEDNDKIEYLCENFKYIQVSFDGIACVQNKHRPISDGRESFNTVDNFVKKCLSHNVKTALRMTVSDFSVAYLSLSIDEFCQRYKNISHIQIEPLSINSRSERLLLNAPSPNIFVEQLFNAIKIGTKYRIPVFSSAANIMRIANKDAFCDAVIGGSLILNPDGLLMNCYEASVDIAELKDYFFVGKISDSGEISLENRKCEVKKITKTSCNKCIAFDFCRGGCTASMLRNKNNKGFHCKITKGITKLLLEDIYINHGNSQLITLHEIYKPFTNVEKIIYWKENENLKRLVLEEL